MLHLDKLLGSTAQARMLSVLRIMFGLLFLQHGMAKLLGFPHYPNYDKIQAFSLLWFAGLNEIITSPLIVLGLFTRLAALLASGEMAVAYFMNRPPRGFFSSLNGGNLDVA